MLAIAWALLGGWILSWFGFKAVVIAGMAQVFGLTINTLGYYFLFAMFGVARKLAILRRGTSQQATEAGKKLGDAVTDLSKKIK
jgi:membrane protein implicated in regulation of membrane protease activity